VKNLIFTFLLCAIFATACEKENSSQVKLIGKWQLVGGYDIMAGGDYSIETENQRIEEYTRDNQRIRYDYLGNVISSCSYRATESVVTIHVEKEDGTKWESSYDYWFSNDTLKIHNVGGFEFYNEYFIRID